MSSQGRGQRLRGRASECATLRGLIATVQSGNSQVLVLRGEAGVGKTALLEYISELASGFRCVQVAGVESDMELAFAGLQQLCAPLLDHLDELPEPQREALNVAFGRGVGPTPDRFLVGLAVLSLMAAAADDQPLLCIIDDAQWLDQVSVQTLAFVARRLLAEPVALVFAARDGGAEALAGLPELVIRGLSDGDARDLLESVMFGRNRPAGARPHRRRDARHSAGPARGASKRLRGGAGRRVLDLRASARRRQRSRTALSRRIQSLPEPTPAAVARRGGRAGGRCCVVSARGGAAGHSGRRTGAGRSRGSDRVRSAHALSPSVDALGRLPCGRSDRTQGNPSGVGRRDRSAVGPRPPGMARRQRRGGTRRRGCRGAGNLGGPGPEQRRYRRGGDVPRARHHFDVGSGPARRQGDRGGAGQTGRGGACGGVRTACDSRTRPAVRPPTRSGGAVARPDGVRRSRGGDTGAPRLAEPQRNCSTPPSDWRTSTTTWPGRPISRRSPLPCTPGDSVSLARWPSVAEAARAAVGRRTEAASADRFPAERHGESDHRRPERWLRPDARRVGAHVHAQPSRPMAKRCAGCRWACR